MKAKTMYLLLMGLISFSSSTYSQGKSISITIDDVPNISKYQNNTNDSNLLDVLVDLNIPFTVFINESKLFKSRSMTENREILSAWIENDNSLIGNHTYSHSRYSDVGFDSFKVDIDQGEQISRKLASQHSKELKYFRFPFNDLGKDAAQHRQIEQYLGTKGYTIAPFTVESSDWMFDSVYQHYLGLGETKKAQAIGDLYVAKTMELLTFYEMMAMEVYQRPIKHVYLCHDNGINTDYLPDIITKLKARGYQIESFSQTLTDPVYQQVDKYEKKWGISWMYRWMDDQNERIKWMKKEPRMKEIEQIHAEIINQ